MLPHPTLDKLQTLRLHGMLKALNEQLKTPDIDSLSFEERLGLLVDRELTERDDKRLSSRLRQGLENLPLAQTNLPLLPDDHANLRGSAYYH